MALGLVAGSAALVAADRSPQARAAADAGLADAAWLGLAQAAALAPGVSRSGAVRSAARARGFTRAAAAELAAETALPVLAGATALKGVRLAARRPAARELAGARGGRGRGGALHGRRAVARAARRAAGVWRRTALRSPCAVLRSGADASRWPAARTGRVRRLGTGARLRAVSPQALRPRRPPQWAAMTAAYASSGVDTGAADRAVAALVGVLKTIDIGRPSRSVLASGHYAAVLEVAPNLGIAVGTDGVGSKLIVAEQTGRYDTVGIDCIAMNVNDVICVGAEPFAVLDYLAVERADEAVMHAIGLGLKAGAEQAGVEIPGGEVAVLPELIRGHPSPHGFDLTAACFGTVALDRLVTGASITPGDALIGLPSAGLHSNGYSLARRALLGDWRASALDATPPALGGASVADAMLEPTVIYVRASSSCCARAPTCAASRTSPAAGC